MNPNRMTEFPVISRGSAAEVQISTTLQQTLCARSHVVALAGTIDGCVQARSRNVRYDLESNVASLAMSKIDLTCAPASNVGWWSGLRLLRLVARALLIALQDSRERAARNIIRDHRHLLSDQAGANSFQDGRKKIARESQGDLKTISRG
ncbi:MAG: hypothetical protein E6G85_11240 [Alphaproteobacteria bacterium]|nr:MAG: hypothetical protein E6G85_11240 [Alphaproteobacteria bacterium]